MRTRATIAILAAVLVAASFAGIASAQESDQVEIVVRPFGERMLVPLAVPDTGYSGESAPSSAAGADELMRRCFMLAGFFRVLGPDTYFFDANAEGISQQSINWENWFNAGAESLIKSAVRIEGGQASLDFRLYDVSREAQVEIDWEAKTVDAGVVRSEVYDFVNAVIEHFTGSRGFFGSRVAFAARDRNGNKQIYTIGLDGSGLSSVTNNNTINLLPAWSAGGQVMYTSYYNDNPDLYVGANNARVISARPGFSMGAAAGPGGEIAVSLSQDGQAEIYILDSSGNVLRRCTNDSGEDFAPTWSPDGSQIAFVSDRSGGPQIYLMNSDCSNQRRLTFRGNWNTSPDWSPRGDVIAFTGRSGRRFDIFTVAPESGYMERLTQDQGSNADPTWSPDGRHLVFTSTRGGGGARLYISTADGQIQQLLSDRVSGVETPAWQR